MNFSEGIKVTLYDLHGISSRSPLYFHHVPTHFVDLRLGSAAQFQSVGLSKYCGGHFIIGFVAIACAAETAA